MYSNVFMAVGYHIYHNTLIHTVPYWIFMDTVYDMFFL